MFELDKAKQKPGPESTRRSGSMKKDTKKGILTVVFGLDGVTGMSGDKGAAIIRI